MDLFTNTKAKAALNHPKVTVANIPLNFQSVKPSIFDHNLGFNPQRRVQPSLKPVTPIGLQARLFSSK